MGFLFLLNQDSRILEKNLIYFVEIPSKLSSCGKKSAKSLLL